MVEIVNLALRSLEVRVSPYCVVRTSVDLSTVPMDPAYHGAHR